MEQVEPFIDITSVYHYMNTGSTPEGQGPPKQSASLATICKQILGVSLSKVLSFTMCINLCLFIASLSGLVHFKLPEILSLKFLHL